VEHDPGYAHALAWLAIAIFGRWWRDPRPEILDEAFDRARAALSLDDTDAQSHLAMGFVTWRRGHLDAAGPYFDRAVALNPTDVFGGAMRAMWLARMGRADEALECLDIIMRRDPFPPTHFWEVRSIALLQARRYEDVIGHPGADEPPPRMGPRLSRRL